MINRKNPPKLKPLAGMSSGVSTLRREVQANAIQKASQPRTVRIEERSKP